MSETGPAPATSAAKRGAGHVADAQAGNWTDRYAPEAWKPYMRLSRFDRLKPAWLLLLPCWWGTFLAVGATGWSWTALWVLVACVPGAFLMRGAGCTWNDITDREFDARVARTRSRPIPSGQVSARQAFLWLVAQSLVALCILVTFHPTAIALGISSLALVAIYPFAKRFTWWPQVFLGLAFNWGALLCWAAVTGSLATAPLALYLSGIAWTLFYDTIYAHQDREDDALIGVKSTARLFGDQTRRWLRWFLVATVVMMGVAVITAYAPGRNMLALVVGLGAPWAMGWHLAWQLRKLNLDDAESCLVVFRSNREAGLIAALFLAVASVL